MYASNCSSIANSHQSVRQPDGEVRPAPARSASRRSWPSLRPGEQAQERGQPVVPVVVAGQRVQRRLRPSGGTRQRRPVRPLRAVLVLLAAGRRVHLVAAHDQHPAARQCASPSTLKLGLARAGRRSSRCAWKPSPRSATKSSQISPSSDPSGRRRTPSAGERRSAAPACPGRPRTGRPADPDGRAGQQRRTQPRHAATWGEPELLRPQRRRAAGSVTGGGVFSAASRVTGSPGLAVSSPGARGVSSGFTAGTLPPDSDIGTRRVPNPARADPYRRVHWSSVPP